MEKHPDDVRRDLERYKQNIKEVDSWKKLMLENPEEVATYLQDVGSELNFIKCIFQKRLEANKKGNYNSP